MKYQVLRSVNGGAYANLGSTIPNTGAADYAVLDFVGPFVQRATYTYEVIISGTTPASPATSNPVQYLYNPVVSHLLFTAGESDLTFNQAGAGDAPTINAANQLQLSDNTNSDANSVYAANSVQINGNWQTSFSYQITNPGADGFTFVIQSNGSNVTGNSGGGLGYAGGNLSSSLAFAFNQFNGVTQTAMGANGTLAPYITMNGALGNAFHPAAASTDLFRASISYDHITGNFYEVIRDTVTGLGYSATFTPALYGAYNITQAQVAALFAGPVYVGFTAGTGGVNSIQTIGDWAFNTIPAPALVGKPVINGNSPNALTPGAAIDGGGRGLHVQFGRDYSQRQCGIHRRGDRTASRNSADNSDGRRSPRLQRHAMGRHPHRRTCRHAGLDRQRRVHHLRQPQRRLCRGRRRHPIGRWSDGQLLPPVRRRQRRRGGQRG